MKEKVMTVAAALFAIAVAAAADRPGCATNGVKASLEERDGMIFLGTSTDERNYKFSGRSAAGVEVDMEVRDGKLYHLYVKPDKPEWNKFYTFVFKESVAGHIRWANGGWPAPDKIKSVKKDGLRYVTPHLPSWMCLYSRRTEVDPVYRLWADGKEVPVYEAYEGYQEKRYFFANFEWRAGAKVRVARIGEFDRLPAAFSACDILPLARKIAKRVVDPNTVEFDVDAPAHCVVEPNGPNSPLFIFANGAPAPTAGLEGNKEIRYEAGVHDAGVIRLGNNQTLRLAEGAVVHGSVAVAGTNVAIRGTGILCGNAYTRFCVDGGHMLSVQRSKSVLIEGITLRGSADWTLVVSGSDGVVIDNVKIMGGRMINDDGIDIVNSRNVVIRGSTVYAQDDCVAPKGVIGFNDAPVENVTVKDCLFWSVEANVLRCGHECAAEAFRNIVFKDCTVLHTDVRPKRDAAAEWPDTVFALEATRGTVMESHLYENIYIDDPRPVSHIAAVRPQKFETMNWSGKPANAKDTSYGHIRNVTFRNIRSTRCPSGPFGRYVLYGATPSNRVENVRFENCTPPADKVFRPAFTDACDFFGETSR